MGGRGTFAAGNPVPYTFETIDRLHGVKILKGIGNKHGLPEEAHSSLAYIQLKPNGTFHEMRFYDKNHYLTFELAYHLCVVIDLFSRKVISFKLSDSAPAALVCETAKTAYAKRGKPEGVLFHSDLGTQYTAYEFFNLVKELKFEQSFSRPGTPFDNAVAESFFATFKKEELYHKEYKSFDELKRGVREYIKYYNNYRPHQKNGYLSPTEFENDYFSRKSGSSGQ